MSSFIILPISHKISSFLANFDIFPRKMTDFTQNQLFSWGCWKSRKLPKNKFKNCSTTQPPLFYHFRILFSDSSCSLTIFQKAAQNRLWPFSINTEIVHSLFFRDLLSHPLLTASKKPTEVDFSAVWAPLKTQICHFWLNLPITSLLLRTLQ